MTRAAWLLIAAGVALGAVAAGVALGVALDRLDRALTDALESHP